MLQWLSEERTVPGLLFMCRNKSEDKYNNDSCNHIVMNFQVLNSIWIYLLEVPSRANLPSEHIKGFIHIPQYECRLALKNFVVGTPNQNQSLVVVEKSPYTSCPAIWTWRPALWKHYMSSINSRALESVCDPSIDPWPRSQGDKCRENFPTEGRYCICPIVLFKETVVFSSCLSPPWKRSPQGGSLGTWLHMKREGKWPRLRIWLRQDFGHSFILIEAVKILCVCVCEGEWVNLSPT